jgi:FkbM family methyltransferase
MTLTKSIKKWIRPAVLPCIHGWQSFRDYGLGILQEYIDRQRSDDDRLKVARDVHGIRFVLYPFDRKNLPCLITRFHDIPEFHVIPSLVENGGTAIDIGANAGLYSVLFSRLCGRTGRVWAFEPVPDTYWRLRETLALNRCENVVPVQAAICDKAGTATMNLFEPQFAEWNSLGVRTVATSDGVHVSPTSSIEVPSYALDRFCDQHQIEHIDFLKVDVEGFELSVFRGAETLLKEGRVDYICYEIAKVPLQSAGTDTKTVIRFLEACGYRTYRLNSESKRFEGPIHDTFEPWANFFASHQDLTNLHAINGAVTRDPLNDEVRSKMSE